MIFYLLEALSFVLFIILMVTAFYMLVQFTRMMFETLSCQFKNRRRRRKTRDIDMR